MAASSRSQLRLSMERLRRSWKKETDLPGDAFAYRMAPLRSGPKGRTGAAAVLKPEEETGSNFGIRFFAKTPHSRH